MPEPELDLLNNYLTVGAILFGLGLVGFIARRNMMIMFLCVEMMLQGVSLSLVAFGRVHGDWGGQMLVIFIIAVAACEAAIALALVLMLFRGAGNLDMAHWHEMREENIPAFVDRELPEAVLRPEPSWPELTPAGVQPETDREGQLHRTHV